MFGLIAPTLIAVLAALASGGSLTNWSQVRLRWSPAELGDVIAQPDSLPLANLVSVGDLLLSIGAAWCAFCITRGNRLRNTESGAC